MEMSLIYINVHWFKVATLYIISRNKILILEHQRKLYISPVVRADSPKQQCKPLALDSGILEKGMIEVTITHVSLNQCFKLIHNKILKNQMYDYNLSNDTICS